MAAIIAAVLLSAATPVKSVEAVKVSGNNRFLLAPTLADVTLLDDPTFTLRAVTEISRDGGVKWERWAHVDWGGGAEIRPPATIRTASYDFPAPPDGVLVRHSLETPKDLVCGLDLVEHSVVIAPLDIHQSVAVVGTPTGSSAISATSLSFALDVGSGSNTALGAGASYAPTARSIATFTYNSVNLTLVPNSSVRSSSSGNLDIYYLLTPTSGSNTIEITMDAASYIIIGGAGMTGVDQTTPLGTAVTADPTAGTAATVTVSGAVGDLIVSALAWWPQSGGITVAVSGGEDQRWNVRSSDTQQAGAGSTEAGAASVAMDWTFTGVVDWAESGVAFKAAAGVAATLMGQALL